MNKTNKPSYNGRTKPSIKTAAPLMNEAKQTIDSLVAEKKQLIKFIRIIKNNLIKINNSEDSSSKLDLLMLVGEINSKLKLYK